MSSNLPAASACLSRLTQLGSVTLIPAGTAVDTASPLGPELLLVEEGCLRLQTTEGCCQTFTSGDIVGKDQFLENLPLDNTLVADQPTRLRRIGRWDLFGAYVQEPVQLHELLSALVHGPGAATPHRPAEAPGGADALAMLACQALGHRAVRHPYLQALAERSLPDIRWALADFARHYQGYSSYFPRFLTTVVSRLDRREHRDALLDNLTEESGIYSEADLAALAEHGVERAWIEGIAHPELFQRFAQALGVDPHPQAVADQVICWREQLLLVLAHGSPAEAIGALGLGTEGIVSTIYAPFVSAIQGIPELTAEASVFFPLHTAVDDHHQETLQRIAAELASSEDGIGQLRRGMLKALQLRASFWDWLHQRALDPANADDVL